MFPFVVLRVRKAVRRLVRPELVEPTGPQIEARWQEMMRAVHRADREAERRLAKAEHALNRLTRS